MSGHTWWPDNDKSWRLWHSPTYEERRNVRDLNSYDSKGWEKPWTKAWDWGSPTGALPRKKLFDSPDKTSGRSSKDNLPVLEIPDEFESDAKFIDKNKRFGKDFPRYVSTSSWSLKHGFQSRDVTSITLAEMCYLGTHNVSLRYLAHGYLTSVVLTRGVKESILGEKLMKEVRGLGVDIDTLSKLVVERESGQSLDTSSLELKTEAIAKFASIMVSKVVKDFPEISMNLKRVRELESELKDGPKPPRREPSRVKLKHQMPRSSRPVHQQDTLLKCGQMAGKPAAVQGSKEAASGRH